MEELCNCSKRMLDADHTPWMFRGRPCCNSLCYRKAAEADDRNLANRKTALRNPPAPRQEVRHAAL